MRACVLVCSSLPVRTVPMSPSRPQFARKFLQRASAYVADWGDSKAMSSQDRTPGLGTHAVEPSDWKDRFCEVKDTRMRAWMEEVRAGKLPGSLDGRQSQ